MIADGGEIGGSTGCRVTSPGWPSGWVRRSAAAPGRFVCRTRRDRMRGRRSPQQMPGSASPGTSAADFAPKGQPGRPSRSANWALRRVAPRTAECALRCHPFERQAPARTAGFFLSAELPADERDPATCRWADPATCWPMSEPRSILRSIFPRLAEYRGRCPKGVDVRQPSALCRRGSTRKVDPRRRLPATRDP